MQSAQRKITLKVLTFLTILAFTSPAWAGFGVGIPSPSASTATGEYLVLIVNQDQFEGQWKQFKGELKTQWGDFTEDDLLEIEGKMDKFEGKMQERYGERKEEVRDWVDQWFDRHTFEAQSSQTTR